MNNGSANLSLDSDSARRRSVGRALSGDFVEPDDPFLDDDQILAESAAEHQDAVLESMHGSKNFLERDDFGDELGDPSESAFSEDFGEVARHEIVEILGTDKASRALVVVYAYRLPSNKSFDFQKFLRYLMQTLDSFVDQDYTILYFHHGLHSSNKPSLRWLVQAYRLLDRKYKKNLKLLCLVHPTKFIKIVWNVFKPFISAKFEKKLRYVNCLRDLRDLVHHDQLVVPREIVDHDDKLQQQHHHGQDSWNRVSIQEVLLLDTQQFGVTLDYIFEHNPDCDIPPAVEKTVTYLEQNGLTEEGLFRRSVNLSNLKAAQARLNAGESIDFSADVNGLHLAACLLKSFLRELKEPIMTYDLFDIMIGVQNIPTDKRALAVKKVVEQLPPGNYKVLKYIMKFLTLVMEKSDANRMNANNLAVVFGPNLAWPSGHPTTLTHLNTLNNFTYHLLTNYSVVFES